MNTISKHSPHAFTAMFLMIAATGLWAGCGGEDTSESDVVIRPVRYAQVFAAGSERARTFTGTAQAASEQNLAFRVAGTVQQVRADVGSRVRRGQTLAWLDPSDYQLQQQQAEATLAQARAQARNAQATYERTLALYENQNASRSDHDAARASYESANASVASSETALRLAGQQVDYTRLYAPVNGIIARVDIEANETVGVGQPVIVINSEGRPEVEVAVPEAFIGGIRSGRSAEVTFDAVPGASFAATVTEVGVTTMGSGTFTVMVRLDEDTERVRPGMAAEVAFSIQGTTSGSDDIVIVPSQAVGQDQDGRFVFVINRTEGGLATVERRVVEVGSLTAEGIEITSGLQDGDYVATAGLRTLAAGQQVRLLDQE